MQLKRLEFDEIDSTNLYLKEHYKELPDWTVVSANYQSQGRGRFNRTFEVEKGLGSICSILLKEDFALNNFELLSILTGVAVAKTLEEYRLEPMIKWPNDVLLNGKKVSGILLEGVSIDKMEALIVGVGINVNQTSFDSELSNAISMQIASNKRYCVSAVREDFIINFCCIYEDFKKGSKEFLAYMRNHNYFKNKEVYALVNNEKRKIKVLDVLDNGHLLIEDNGKKIEMNSGELTFHNVQ